MLLSCVIIQAQKKCWWNLKHDKFQADKTIGHFLFLFSFFSVHILVCWAEKQESACCFRKESTLMGFNRWFRKSKFFEAACSVLIYACVYGYFLLSLTSACFSYNHWLLMVGLDFFLFFALILEEKSCTFHLVCFTGALWMPVASYHLNVENEG